MTRLEIAVPSDAGRGIYKYARSVEIHARYARTKKRVAA